MTSETATTTISQDQSSNDSLSGNLSQTANLEFLSSTIPLIPEEDSCVATHSDMEVEIDDAGSKDDEVHSEEALGVEDDNTRDGHRHIVDGHEVWELIPLCDFCQGPILRGMRRSVDDAKKFCCPKCLAGFLKIKGQGIKSKQKGHVFSKDGNSEGPSDFNWEEYREIIEHKAAPSGCFKRLTKDVKGLKAGMKLEALDKNNPCNYCVATVISVVGHRVQICYDGFGYNEGQDFWCNFQAEELFPIGWCAGNGYPLQPPTGISSSLEDWKTFLTTTLTGALAAPIELFRESEQRMQLRVHSFQAGMKVECIHPKKPDVICPATVTKSLGPYLYQVSTISRDAHQDPPTAHFFGHSDTQGVFQAGWASKHGLKTWSPIAKVIADGPDEKLCIHFRKMPLAVSQLSQKRPRCNRFKIGQKLEAVDMLNQSVIRVATVLWMTGRILLLAFDGTNHFQFVDCESEDIYPCGWCRTTGHPLHTCYGIDMPSDGSGKCCNGRVDCDTSKFRTILTSNCEESTSSGEESTTVCLESGPSSRANGRSWKCHREDPSEHDHRIPRFSKPINVQWTLSGIEKTRCEDSRHIRYQKNAGSAEKKLVEAIEKLEETVEEGLMRVSRHLKILTSRVEILEEKFELTLLNSKRKRTRTDESEEPKEGNSNIKDVVHVHCGTQTESASCNSQQPRTSPTSHLISDQRHGSPQRVPPGPMLSSSSKRLRKGPAVRVSSSQEQGQLLPQIMEVMGCGSYENQRTENREIISTNSASVPGETIVYVPGEHVDEAISSDVGLIDNSLSNSSSCTIVKMDTAALPKTALLNKTLRTPDEAELFATITPEQLNAVTIVSRQQSKRHEFALKVLDVFYTEEEQASLKEPGGGCLRNLDLDRLQKIKGLCFFYYPVKDDETEEGSWKFIIQKINSKCRCRRFTYKQKMQATS